MVSLTSNSLASPGGLVILQSKLMRSVRRLKVTPSLPAGRMPKLGAADDLLPGAGGRDKSRGWAGFAVYRDAKGERSERRITCRKLSGYGTIELVHAFCHERQAYRSFRVDRFEELMDIATGELLDPLPHFEALRQQGALLMEDKALTRLALILVFMACCDGEYHPLEREAIEYCISRYMLRFGGEDQDIERLLVRCDSLAPDGLDFLNCLKALSNLKNGPHIARLVLEGTGSVIDADGYHHEAEIEWGLYVDEYLKRLAVRK